LNTPSISAPLTWRDRRTLTDATEPGSARRRGALERERRALDAHLAALVDNLAHLAARVDHLDPEAADLRTLTDALKQAERRLRAVELELQGFDPDYETIRVLLRQYATAPACSMADCPGYWEPMFLRSAPRPCPGVTRKGTPCRARVSRWGRCKRHGKPSELGRESVAAGPRTRAR
jgi:hypothetical protein